MRGCFRVIKWLLLLGVCAVVVVLALVFQSSGNSSPTPDRTGNQNVSVDDRIIAIADQSMGVGFDNHRILSDPQTAIIQFDISGSLIEGFLGLKILQAACDIWDVDIQDRDLRFVGFIPVVDGNGNQSSRQGIFMRLNRDTMGSLDCANVLGLKPEVVADEYFGHELLEG